MAKKRKKYNPLKSAQSCAKAGLKDLIITFNAEDQDCKVRSIKSGKEAYTWMEVESPFPVYHEEINDSLSDQHAAFIAEEKAKGNQIINLGWLASHEGLRLDNDRVEFLLEAAGV
jgi:hypothetical protein